MGKKGLSFEQQFMERNFKNYRAEENSIEYNFNFMEIEQMVINMFSWEGLPKGCTNRFVEETLFYSGLLVAYKNKMGFFDIRKAAPMMVNPYGEPVGYHCYGYNGGYTEDVQASECVPIWNNDLRIGSQFAAAYYAKRIWKTEAAIDVNMEQLKHPYIITCPESQRASVKDIMRRVNDGEPYVLVNDAYKEIKFNVFNLDIKNHASELFDLKRNIKDECHTHFGINNVDIHKKERLVSGETEQNDEAIELNRNSMYRCRLKAVKDIKEKFNIDIQVVLSKDMEYLYSNKEEEQEDNDNE